MFQRCDLEWHGMLVFLTCERAALAFCSFELFVYASGAWRCSGSSNAELVKNLIGESTHQHNVPLYEIRSSGSTFDGLCPFILHGTEHHPYKGVAKAIDCVCDAHIRESSPRSARLRDYSTVRVK